MKRETYANKLAALLGLTEVKQELDEKKAQRNGNIVGVTEEEIQDFRQAQGLIYFLQAPALFQAKVCKHCGETYLVSRMYVAFCSYTCIRKDLEARGFQWRKGHDIEALVKESYDGNEPLWIHNLEKLREALEYLTSSTANVSSLVPESRKEVSGTLVTSSS